MKSGCAVWQTFMCALRQQLSHYVVVVFHLLLCSYDVWKETRRGGKRLKSPQHAYLENNKDLQCRVKLLFPIVWVNTAHRLSLEALILTSHWHLPPLIPICYWHFWGKKKVTTAQDLKLDPSSSGHNAPAAEKSNIYIVSSSCVVCENVSTCINVGAAHCRWHVELIQWLAALQAPEKTT